MKFIKNCFILLMAAVAALPLAACGKGKTTTELSGGGAYYTFVDHAGTKIVLNDGGAVFLFRGGVEAGWGRNSRHRW